MIIIYSREGSRTCLMCTAVLWPLTITKPRQLSRLSIVPLSVSVVGLNAPDYASLLLSSPALDAPMVQYRKSWLSLRLRIKTLG